MAWAAAMAVAPAVALAAATALALAAAVAVAAGRATGPGGGLARRAVYDRPGCVRPSLAPSRPAGRTGRARPGSAAGLGQPPARAASYA